MSSITSQLFDQVDSALIADNQIYSVTVIDALTDTSIYENEVEVANPFDFDWSRLVPAAMDYPRFLQIAQEVVADAQAREGVVEGQRVSIVSDFPNEEFQRFGNEVITYRLISRTPANMNPSATGRKQRAATFSHDLRLPTNPNKVVVVYKRPIDHVVEFSCWSKSADIADRRALWLERLFVTHAWAFKIQGADRFYWNERGIDTYMTTGGGVKLYQRPVRFFVRLHECQMTMDPVIQRIDFEISQP